MSARIITAADLARALGGLARRPAVRAAVRERAETVADAAAGEGIAATVAEDPAGATVTLAGAGLFAREFGARDAVAEAVVPRAIESIRR